MKKSMKNKIGKGLVLLVSLAVVSLILTDIRNENLSIVGGSKVDVLVNQQYNTSISLPFATPDTNWADGTYESKYGKWFILNSTKGVIFDSGWSSTLTASPYTATATFKPTIIGTYYLVAVIDTQKYVYGTTWTMTESIETKEAQQINAKYPAPPVNPPTTTILSILTAIWDWLMGIFGL